MKKLIRIGDYFVIAALAALLIALLCASCGKGRKSYLVHRVDNKQQKIIRFIPGHFKGDTLLQIERNTKYKIVVDSALWNMFIQYAHQ